MDVYSSAQVPVLCLWRQGKALKSVNLEGANRLIPRGRVTKIDMYSLHGRSIAAVADCEQAFSHLIKVTFECFLKMNSLPPVAHILAYR